MTQPMIEKPSGLRTTVERLKRKSKRQEIQIERLTRMVLLERLKDSDIDMAEGLALLDSYRPEYSNEDDYSKAFSVAAVEDWLAARRAV